ncbi:hypothetical protein DL96DRAFT_1251589 [Flagelloscypha sp. PMI_526]|nr:hypothetical protein DL96DRAFT_1251589 [Flagelloscypha sp. PMI_526]
MMSHEKTALLIGATGRTGRRLLPLLLASNSGFAKVAEYGRRVTPKDQLPVESLSRLEQKVIDFEKISESGLKDGKWDVVFITLATTQAIAGSPEQFEKIDKGYVLSAAKEAKSTDSEFKQRIVYISAVGSDPASRFIYSRCKGLTEEGLAKLGYDDTIIFRPAILKGEDRNLLEKAISPFTSALSLVSSNVQIQFDALTKAVLKAGQLGSSSLPAGIVKQDSWTGGPTFSVIGNASALKLAKT